MPSQLRGETPSSGDVTGSFIRERHPEVEETPLGEARQISVRQFQLERKCQSKHTVDRLNPQPV